MSRNSNWRAKYFLSWVFVFSQGKQFSLEGLFSWKEKNKMISNLPWLERVQLIWKKATNNNNETLHKNVVFCIIRLVFSLELARNYRKLRSLWDNKVPLHKRKSRIIFCWPYVITCIMFKKAPVHGYSTRRLQAVDDGTVKCTAVLGKRLAWSAYYVRKQR